MYIFIFSGFFMYFFCALSRTLFCTEKRQGISFQNIPCPSPCVHFNLLIILFLLIMIDQQSNHCKYCNSDNPCERILIPFCFCSFYILPGRLADVLCVSVFCFRLFGVFFCIFSFICFFCNCRCWCLGRFCSLSGLVSLLLLRPQLVSVSPVALATSVGVTLTSATASTLSSQYPGVPSSILLFSPDLPSLLFRQP